ncbi:MAG: hypothetical protein FWB86_09195 [Treponema sp.]|nr:hypothetical protein [Treponema sp.]MCL2251255.1 hypothetical protein [Treponema sp.]
MGFKKCSAGHIHDSEIDECPFCSGITIEQALAALPPEDEDEGEDDDDDLEDIAMCYDMGPRWIDDDIDFPLDDN